MSIQAYAELVRQAWKNKQGIKAMPMTKKELEEFLRLL